MDPAYTTWVFHGESPSDDVQYEDVEMPEAYRLYHDFYFQDDKVEGTLVKVKRQKLKILLEKLKLLCFLVVLSIQRCQQL